MEKIKSYKDFNENNQSTNHMFKLLHGALDKSKLIPIKNVLNKKGHLSKKDFGEIIEFMGIDPNYFYYVPNDYINPYIYWKGPILIDFFKNISLESIKILRFKERFEQISERIDKYVNQNDYESIFSFADKKIIIPLYIEIYNKIPDEQKYEIFIDLYMRSEFGFEQFKPDFLDKVFLSRKNSQEWKKRMEHLFDIIKPDEKGYIMAYRGESIAEDILSWTLSKKVATFFATRFGNKGKVIYDKVKVDHIMDYLTDRGESELLVNKS